uniref:RdRp n=1 Tax=viral metagenome TaxID=1070528 RepID=A0A2V0RC59_9ZZZZ
MRRMRGLWDKHRTEFLEQHWLPNPVFEARSQFRNILVGWLRQFDELYPGNILSSAFSPTDERWVRDEIVEHTLTVWAQRAEYTNTLNMRPIEFLQRRLLPEAYRQIRDQFLEGKLSEPFTNAIRLRVYHNEFRRRRGRIPKYATYHHLEADFLTGTPATTVRTDDPNDAEAAARLRSLDPRWSYTQKAKSDACLAPIAPNPGLWLEGRVNIAHGQKPSRVSDTSNIVGDHMREELPHHEQLDPRRVIVFPGSETLLADLETTAGNYPTFGGTREDIDLAVKQGGARGLKFRHILSAETWENPGAVLVNPKASSGFDLQGVGANRRGSALHTQRLAERVVKATKASPIASCGVWQLGGRAKRKTPELGSKLAARAIVYDNSISATVSSTISQPFSTMVKSVKGDIQIGHTDVRGGAARDRRVSEQHLYETEIDHKRFGFRLSEPLLVSAFGIIRACLPTGEEWDNRILHEMSKVILKFLILPGGWVYRWTFGNPSGPWTSLLDSICNWLACSSALAQLKVPPWQRTLWIYGDDTLIGWKCGSSARVASEIQDILLNKFGILAGDSQDGKLSRYNTGEPGVTFLSSWHEGGRFGRPLNKWLDVSALPEKPNFVPGAQFRRCAYLSHAAWLTPDNTKYFNNYFHWINNKINPVWRLPSTAVDKICEHSWSTAAYAFASGGDDTRTWERGGNTRLNTIPSPKRAPINWGARPLADLSTSLTLSWLYRGNRDEGDPSILGFRQENLDSSILDLLRDRSDYIYRLR